MRFLRLLMVAARQRHVQVLIAGAMLSVVSVLGARAQSDGSVSGYVRDSLGRPVQGATVRLDTAMRAGTDGDGHFQIRRASPGNHVIVVRRIGFLPLTSPPFEVAAGRDTTLNLVLASEPPRLLREVHLKCSQLEHQDRGVMCTSGRPIPSPCCAPGGVGLIRERTTWRMLWDLY